MILKIISHLSFKKKNWKSLLKYVSTRTADVILKRHFIIREIQNSTLETTILATSRIIVVIPSDKVLDSDNFPFFSTAA